MYMPSSLSTHKCPYQPLLSNGLPRTSYYPTLKPQSYATEQLIDYKPINNKRPQIKRRSVSSSLSVPLYKMQQQTTDEVAIGVPSRLCSVCGDISTGIHFGGNSCESCKAFFRRSVQCLRFQNYKCSNEEKCPVNIVTRKVCQSCRYAKCTAIGMKPKWVLSDQEREEKYGARRKRFRENRATEEDPDIYKFLTKEEKLLIEDIAHALYQSRATYPLHFPSPAALFTNPLNPQSDTTNASSSNKEKPSSAPANLLIVPIQRLVLFARMLKDFDLFSEDDKVSLLKGSAIEIMVCSSNTLFNPKTHTFTNYLSRDQRAVMDDQILPLDPLLTKLWGEDIFNRTRNFLISMCNLHTDEVTSTLLVPIILFSSDRLNVLDINLVKRLQEKYATLLRKYMNWRYGIEQTEIIYSKLLLQIINIRSLGLAHGEIIQKFMATSNVNPLVQEVAVKPDIFNKSTTEKMDSLSISSSSPPDTETMDFDKTPSNDPESNNGSDDDDFTKNKQRSPINDDNDDFDETNPRNIWRKRRKLSDNRQVSSILQTELTNNSNNNPMKTTHDYPNVDKQPRTNRLYMRPYDHQVPTIIPAHHDDFMVMSSSGYSIPNQFRQLPLKNPLLVTSPRSIEQLNQLYRTHSSSTSDLSSYDHYSRPNLIHNPTMLPPSGQYYDDQTHVNDRQHYARMSSTDSQHQNEQQLHQLSLAMNRNQPLSFHPLNSHQSQSTTSLPTRTILDNDEQQLLNAIHAHPNKRDLVLNLLRQMNQPTSSVPQEQQQQQQHYSGPSANYKPYRRHSNMDNDDELL